jgi:hypothetical protein
MQRLGTFSGLAGAHRPLPASRAGRRASAASQSPALGVPGQKGGRLAGPAAAAEVVDELPEGGVGIAEALGGLLLRAAIEEDAAERLVLTLGDASGSQEEIADRVVGHGIASECEVIAERRGVAQNTKKG